MKDSNEKILDIKVNYRDAIKAIAEYQTKIDELKDSEAELKKEYRKGEISREEYNKSMTASKMAVNDYKDSIRVLSKEVKNNLKVEKTLEGSLVQLRAQLSNLTAEYDAMSAAERESAEGHLLQDKINEVTDALKQNEEETQRFYRNVGNYKNSMIEAAEANIPFLEKIQQITGGASTLKSYFHDVSDEMKTVITTTKGMTRVMKLLKVAFISTGIGALVVGLGALISYFARTQSGVEGCTKVMSALGAVTDVLLDRLAKFGSMLVSIFTLDFKQAAADAKAAFSGIADEIASETKQAVLLAKALTDIEKKEVMLSMSRAANRAEIEKLKKAADDMTLSTAERIAAAEKAAAIEKEDLKVQTKLAEARLANTLGFTAMNSEVEKLMKQIKAGDVTADEVIGKLGLSESTLEDLKVFRDQFNELQDLMETSYGRQTEQQNTLNSIRKEGEELAREAREKQLAEARKAEDESLKLLKDKREAARIETDRGYTRQIEDLRIRLREEKNLTVTARMSINEQILYLEKQKQQKLKQLSDEQTLADLGRTSRIISLQLEAVKQGSEQEFQLRMQQLFAQRSVELAEKELTEEMKLAIYAKYSKKIEDLSVEHENNVTEKQKELMRIRFETQIAEAYGNEETQMRIRLEQKKNELDEIHRLEGESIEAFNLRKLEAENEYLAAKKELKDEEIRIETEKAEALASLAGQLSSLLEQAGNNNKAAAQLAKVLAIAEVSIAQGVAIAKAVKTATSSSATWIDMLAAISTVVTSVTSVMGVAMKSIKSAKFAKGGLVTGPGSESSDSIPAQLSNGESVLTARATQMFAPILSSFNQMGGGVPINVSETGNQTLGEDMLARAVAKGVSELKPVVSVEEISAVANRVKTIENLGTL